MKRLLVDKNISNEAMLFLESLGYSIIVSTTLKSINNSTSTHPDMQFVKTGNKKAIVSLQSLDYYKLILPDFYFIAVEGIKSPYPYDTALNFVLLGNKAICTEYQYKTVDYLKNYDCTIVNQGYTKCSVCVLNENAIITGDQGIVNTLKKTKIKAYYLPCNEVKLSGYDYGFWGGASGLIDANKLFINGNIENLSCYSELMDILKQQNIEPVYHKNVDVYDNGSIILLD